MSKKFKGKTCVYCATPGASEDGDHVISREFFLPEQRANLPKVPACKACNSSKSELEHYLTAVMPFGARHSQSARTLAELVPARLEKNKKLQRQLRKGSRETYVSRDGSDWTVETSLPFDGNRLVRLLELIAKGLAFHHWGVYLPDATHVCQGGFVIERGREAFESLLSMNAAARVKANLGPGAFIYEGAQGVDSTEVTVWRMRIYGAELEGDPRAPGLKCVDAYVLTAPRRMPTASRIAQWLAGQGFTKR